MLGQYSSTTKENNGLFKTNMINEMSFIGSVLKEMCKHSVYP